MRELTPYAESLAPMTRKQKKEAMMRYTFVRDSFHLSAAVMAGVAQGSVPPFSPSRDVDDGTGVCGSLSFVGAGSMGRGMVCSSMAEIVVVEDMLMRGLTLMGIDECCI